LEFNIGVVVVAPAGNPPDQVYVFAPDAFSVAVNPAQMVGELTTTFGLGVTVTLDTAVFVHPFASVPVTV
jgi:hypothetical protein